MALVFADRVRETTSTAGTGTFSLLGAVSSCQSFSAIGNGNTTYYTAVNQVGTEWEVGLGTYNAGTITRDTILSSSNGGAIVNFSAGTKDIFCDYPAGKAVLVDGSGNTYAPNIGGTTASAGTFTNGTLKGTGQNLILQSNTWTAAWSPGNLTAATTVATTDPLGTNTAYQLTESTDASPVAHAIGQGFTAQLFAGSTYTWSMYIKAANRSWAYVSNFDNTRRGAWFDLSTGTLGTVEAGVTAVISNQGNGWYRCSVTTTLPSGVPATYPYMTVAPSNGVENYTGTGVVSLYVWRAQLEISATPSTYIATTSSIVWNVPTLSFISSATSSIGLQSNGSLYIQPAGTGGLQAQATTSTISGGNARGANAVDWQTSRGAASQVAGGTLCFIGGGNSNTSTGYSASLVGGVGNTSNGSYSFTGGGLQNNPAGPYAAIASGFNNNARGYYNFIGSGYANTGTSQSAVTTQGTTSFTSGSASVTLSASNAAIKVGQIVTGTGIVSYPNDTYVSAISGTALTLSQNANATGTPTLSFFTPHGVVVGGGNNVSSGGHSFVGGGGWAGGVSGGSQTNRATGSWSTVGGGSGGLASGDNSFVGGGGYQIGNGNTASGQSSAVVGGYSNSASGFASVVIGGAGNTATGNYGVVGGANNTNNAANGVITGGQYGNARGITGYHVFAASAAPIAQVTGITQAALVVLARQTTDATPTVLASDPSAASTVNQVILPNNSAYYFKGSVIANVTGAANGAAWSFEGAIMRGANAASTVLIGTVTLNRIAATAGASLWTVALTADTTNGGLAVTVTGLAATTIRWVAKVETTETTF